MPWPACAESNPPRARPTLRCHIKSFQGSSYCYTWVSCTSTSTTLHVGHTLTYSAEIISLSNVRSQLSPLSSSRSNNVSGDHGAHATYGRSFFLVVRPSTRLKRNLNACKPSQHAPNQEGESSKRLGGNKDYKENISSWD